MSVFRSVSPYCSSSQPTTITQFKYLLLPKLDTTQTGAFFFFILKLGPVGFTICIMTKRHWQQFWDLRSIPAHPRLPSQGRSFSAVLLESALPSLFHTHWLLEYFNYMMQFSGGSFRVVQLPPSHLQSTISHCTLPGSSHICVYLKQMPDLIRATVNQ